MKIQLFGKEAKELAAMENPQVHAVRERDVEGRTVVELEIRDEIEQKGGDE